MAVIAHSTTDRSEYFYVVDSATGAAKTGLTATNASAYYTRNRAAAVTVGSITNLAAVTTAHTDAGLIEVSAANSPGLYRLDVPDAAYATGVDKVTVHLKWSAGAAIAAPMQHELRAFEGTGNINADIKAVNGTAGNAAALAASLSSMVVGAVDTATFTPTNSGSFVFEGTLPAETTADHMNGRVVVFTSGELLYCATSITDYEWSGNSKPKFTCPQIQAIAGSLSGITFVIV